MAGFRKAKCDQAALKLGMYGAPGSGKTFTSLLIAEGIARSEKKRVAYVDTEFGTSFYCKSVESRKPHPEAFDFDALYTRSLSDTMDAFRSIKPEEYSVVVIDSITHLWEAARNAYDGRKTRVGTIPMQAWAQIKKPYRELINALLSSSIHVIICGRQGVEYSTDEESDELKAVGTKMKAEGETPYEPHILLHLESKRDKKGSAILTAFAEKDRTGVLAGRLIQLWPSETSTFDLLAKPLLPLLGGCQAQVESEDEASIKDSEAIADAEEKKARESSELLTRYKAKLDLAETQADVKVIAAEITPALKKRMTTSDVASLRDHYSDAERRIGKNK